MEQLANDFSKLVGSFGFAIPVVFGLVEFLKAAFSLEGKAVTFVSFAVGVVSAGVVFAGQLFPEIAVYITGGYFIVASGLVASGYYKFVNARWPRAE